VEDQPPSQIGITNLVAAVGLVLVVMTVVLVVHAAAADLLPSY